MIERRWMTLAFALWILLTACCPAPVGLAETPTAFEATLVEVDGNGWIAQARDGSRYRINGVRIEGETPVTIGASVYLEGTVASDGAVSVTRASVIAGS